MALVPLRDRDDEPQVRVHHPLLRGRVAVLDPLRERHLLGCGQKRVPPDLVQEQLQAVRATAGRRTQVEPGLRVDSGLFDLDVGRGQRSLQRLDGVLVEFVLVLQRLELGGPYTAPLLCVVQEGGQGWIQFYEGVSAQFIRAQQFLQGVVSKPTLEVSARQYGPPEASLTCTTQIFP